MCKVIVFENQKGGVGKTTTVLNFGVALAAAGYRVLIVDNDPQGHIGIGFGYEPDELDTSLATLYNDVMVGNEFEWDKGILHHREMIQKGAREVELDFMPGNVELSEIEVLLVNAMSRETVLRRYLETVKPHYDYILIDCNPSLGVLVINALTAADSVIIPVETEYYSARSMELLLKSIGKVRKNLNPKLKIEGVLFTKVRAGTLNSQEFPKIIHSKYGEHLKIFENEIPLAVAASYAPAACTSVLGYDPNSTVANAYLQFAEEFLRGDRNDR